MTRVLLATRALTATIVLILIKKLGHQVVLQRRNKSLRVVLEETLVKVLVPRLILQRASSRISFMRKLKTQTTTRKSSLLFSPSPSDFLYFITLDFLKLSRYDHTGVLGFWENYDDLLGKYQ